MIARFLFLENRQWVPVARPYINDQQI